jgi:H+/Cl- antiporter ClcA
MKKELALLADKLKEKWNHGEYRESFAYMCVGLLSGLICCLYASVFSKLEEIARNLFSGNTDLIFLFGPVTMVMALALVAWFAPGAFGSGIPQVICCAQVKSKKVSQKYLNLKTIAIKILSSLIALFGGAAIGREGPSLQISAAIGNNFGLFFEKLGIKIKNEQLIIAGAASGLAAAFNTPIGGIVYAIEELAQDHIRSYKTALLMSVLVAGFTAQLLLGSYLYLGYPEISAKSDFFVLSAVASVSVVSGIAGSLFSKFLLLLTERRKRLSLKNQFVVAALVGVTLAFFYYFMGSRAIFSGKESINFVLFDSGPLTISECAARFFAPLLSSSTGIAGGIFSPSLSAGASIGGLIAHFFDPSLRTMLGLSCMIGFLTGVTHTPITSFVLVLEMTDRHSAIFPMMLAAVFSSLGAKLLHHNSFYEAVAEQLIHKETSVESSAVSKQPSETAVLPSVSDPGV